MKKVLEFHAELYWWNMGTKTLSFEGTLKELLKNQGISFTKRKSEHEGLYIFRFKSNYDISFKVRGSIYNFPHYAKQMIQMELVCMGDKSQLHVTGCWRPRVTVNF